MSSAGVTLSGLLGRAVELGATDLHLRAACPPAVRVGGNVRTLEGPPVTADDVLDMIQDVLSRTEFSRFLDRNEVDESVRLDGIMWRVQAYWYADGPALALRRLAAEVPSMEELGVPRVARTWIEQRAGLVIVSGPTGAGKTTTLAAMIERINETRACHVVTIEDPIEYRHSPKKAIITQRQVGKDTRDFASALRAVVREDPDVILVGEMRDPESMRAALGIAEAGHLVLTTLHTSSAVEVPSRIVDALPASDQAMARVQLAGTLLGVLTQVLVPRIGGERETDPLRQRVAAFEVMAGTSGVRALIREGKYHQLASQMQLDAPFGSISMEGSLAELVASGVVSEEAALAASLDPERFRAELGRRLRRGVLSVSGHTEKRAYAGG